MSDELVKMHVGPVGQATSPMMAQIMWNSAEALSPWTFKRRSSYVPEFQIRGGGCATHRRIKI